MFKFIGILQLKYIETKKLQLSKKNLKDHSLGNLSKEFNEK